MLEGELAAALLRALDAEWGRINWSHFRERLRPPTLALVDADGFLARWVLETRRIEVTRQLALGHPWATLVEVLKHEMAHQYVHEHLGILDESAHGPRFREVCRTLAIDGAATGLPTTDPAEAHVLDRVQKLLALAASDNRNEAEAAMAAAQRLLLKHNLAHRAETHARGFAARAIGAPALRRAEHEQRLATLLAKHFFVQTIWIPVYLPLLGRHGSVLEAIGTPGNLEIAAYVHEFLLGAAESAWRLHKRAQGIRGDRDRRMYLAGVVAGFATKLDREAQASREQGLVWVEDGDLAAHFRRRHPRLRTTTFGGGRKRAAFGDGHSAGQQIVLRRGVGGAAEEHGRLLPPRRG